MEINCDALLKKFGKQIIVKDFNQNFSQGQYALLGHNGSGKSTLLRVLAGMQQADEGEISWTIQGKKVDKNALYQYVSFTAPAFDLPEALTVREFLEFHFSLKTIHPDYTIRKILEALNMWSIRDRLLEDFSSGMLQRIKLAQAFFTDSPFLFIDEPTSNLDQDGKDLFQEWFEQFKNDRIIILASNEIEEYRQVSEENRIKVVDYQ